MSSRWMRNSLIYLLIVITVITVFFLWFDDGIGQSREISISEVIQRARTSDRLQIEVTGDDLTIIDGSQTFKSRKEPGSSVVETLQNAGVDASKVSVKVGGSSGLGTFFGV